MTQKTIQIYKLYTFRRKNSDHIRQLRVKKTQYVKLKIYNKKDGFGGHEPGEVQHFACVISHASFLLQRLACSMVSFQFILFLLELPPTLIVMANCHSKKWTNQQKIGSFKEQLCKDTFSYTVVWLTSKTL